MISKTNPATLSGRIALGSAVAKCSEGTRFASRLLYTQLCNSTCTVRKALQRVVVTDSQLDLPYLMPLSVAGCDQLKQGVAHWAALATLLQVVGN